MKKLLDLITKPEANILNQKLINSSVSTSSVGWHIEHTLLVINQIVTTVQASDASKYQPKFSFLKLIIFITQKIPRGKAKAPKLVHPKDDITSELLEHNLKTATIAIQKLSQLQPNQYFEHPIFGKLNVKQTIKFLAIHTSHHLHIINDIVKSGK